MATKTPAAQWKRLCKEWRAAQRAANRFPLFERGQMRLDRLDEWKRLCTEDADAKARMDAFIAGLKPRA
jgi:hypothetical protein